MTAHLPQPAGTAADHLAALDHGADLARWKRREKATAKDAIWAALKDAIVVVEAGPDRERAMLKGRSAVWGSATGLTRAEAAAVAKVRTMSGIRPWDRTTTDPRTGNDADRAMLALEWLRWLDRYKDGLELHKAATVLLCDGDPRHASRLYRPVRKFVPQTTAEIKARTIGAIMMGLREDYGIVPGHGCAFVAVG